MKKIYMVQAANTLSKSIYLPYSSGAVIAYSLMSEKVRANFELCDFIYEIKPIDEIIPTLENPAVVGFSSYMWNIQFNLELAEAIKKKWPDCMIVFGGPQVDDEAELIIENRFIDILIHGEGEKPFLGIFEYLLGEIKLSDINNISFFEDGRLVQTKRDYTSDISNYPSPYTMGLFDKIINDPNKSDIQFDVILETNRGCPYKCIYCYWAGREEKFRCFPIEKVKSELRWMAENKIAFCFCADSNFGILDRDIEIVKYIVELKKKYGYPERFESAATKNKDDVAFTINKILHDADLNGGISVAVQSMSPKVLKAIGRKNLSVEEYKEQLNLYRKNGMNTYTDFILGLPEETYESFCHGVFAVLEAGQHKALNVFRCELLPNTILSDKSTMEKYGIKTVRSNLRQHHSTFNESQYNSCSNIIVSTNTLSEEEWVKCNRLAICIQAFHCFGLLRYIAIYLRKAGNVSYFDFYMNLFGWIENESVTVKNILDETCSRFEPFLKNESDLYFYNKEFGNIYFPFEEATFLLCISQIEEVYKEIRKYLDKYNPDERFNELFEYQKDMICLPCKKFPRTVTYENDWYSYFQKLYEEDFKVPEKNALTIAYDSYDFGTMENYAREVVWYGKRKDKMIEKNITII